MRGFTAVAQPSEAPYPLDREALKGNKAVFWQQVMGEWWRPKGPTSGEPLADPRGVDRHPRAQAWKPFEDYNLMLPMPRLIDKLYTLWIEVADYMPTTAFPLLLPRVQRSGIQPVSIIRTAYWGIDTMDRAYPIAENANTKVDLRFRSGQNPGMKAGSPTQPKGAVRQGGFLFQRRAQRIPRYSTQPMTTDPFTKPLKA